jgi:hypothetical protein
MLKAQEFSCPSAILLHDTNPLKHLCGAMKTLFGYSSIHFNLHVFRRIEVSNQTRPKGTDPYPTPSNTLVYPRSSLRVTLFPDKAMQVEALIDIKIHIISLSTKAIQSKESMEILLVGEQWRSYLQLAGFIVYTRTSKVLFI